MKKLLTVFSVLILIVLTSFSFSQVAAIKQIDALSLEEKIGQMMMVGIRGKNQQNTSGDILRRYHVGGIILFRYNIGSPDEIRSLCGSIQENALSQIGIPEFISTDQEGGMIIRIRNGVTQFPGNIAFGSADDPKLTRAAAQIIGSELVSLGINMNLAPVVDINNNPQNPIINMRSFGSDPERVSNHAAAFIEGLQSAGCMAVAKHFPGQGNTNRDSHKTLPVIHAPFEQIDSFELRPFKAAVSAQVCGIMSAHISYPEILKSSEPATLSRFFLTDVLRTKMKFKGLSITDDLEMGAIAQKISIGEAAIRAVDAGADVVLISSNGKNVTAIYNALVQAVKKGRISEDRINESVERILAAKNKFIKNNETIKADPEESLKLNREVCTKALYLFDKNKAFDLITDQILVVTDDAFFSSQFSANSNVVLLKPAAFPASAKQYAGKTLVITASSPSDRIFRQAAALRGVFPNLIIVYTGNPFLLYGKTDLPAVLFTFSTSEESMRAAALALKKELKPKRDLVIDIFGTQR